MRSGGLRCGRGRHVCLLKKEQTPTDSPATGSYMHPTGPRWADTHTHCHYCGTRAAIRLSRFAVTTPLSQEPAFTGAGPCLKRGQVQHADGCLVSTRSCTAAPVGVATIVARLVGVRLPPLLWGGASVARHNPIRHALAGGPAVHCQAAATYQAELVVEKRVGLSGRLPKSPSRGIQGPGSSCRCHCCGAAVAADATVVVRWWRAPRSESPGATCSSIPTAMCGR